MSRQVTLTPVLPEAKRREFVRLDLVGDAQLSGGVGAWSVVSRPRRTDALEFTGVTGLTYVLPLLLDGMEASPGVDVSVELGCTRLLDWAGTVKKQTRQPVVVTAPGPLKTSPAIRWAITDLEWGAQVRVGGYRVQQYVTVTLTQYRSATVRTDPAKRSRQRKGK